MRSLLWRDQGQDGRHHPDPDERDRRDREQHERGAEVRVRHVQAEERGDDAEEQRRSDDAVGDREQAHPDQVHRPRERGHEGVLDRPLPALPGNRLGEDLEDDPEVGPDHGPDQQDRRQLADVDLAARRLDPAGDEHDRERVGCRPEEERKLPPGVALDQVPVPLDDPAEPDQLVTDGHGNRSHQAYTSRSSSSSASCSNERPVAAKNASSSVAAS